MVDVLDTAALLNWPAERICLGICAFSQLPELGRLSEPRLLLVEANPPDLQTPTKEDLELALKAAAKTGDLDGLSEVDLDVMALAIKHTAILHTDDYRLQNIAKASGIAYRSVSTKGISSSWSWELRCSGCRASAKVPENTQLRECDICGSPQQLKRVR